MTCPACGRIALMATIIIFRVFHIRERKITADESKSLKARFVSSFIQNIPIFTRMVLRDIAVYASVNGFYIIFT